MTTIEMLKKLSLECKVPDVLIDENTLVISEEILPLSSLKANDNEGGLGYNINLDSPRKVWATHKIENGFVYETEAHAWLVRNDRLEAVIPVYELSQCSIKKNKLLLSGHENQVVVTLDNLMNSVYS